MASPDLDPTPPPRPTTPPVRSGFLRVLAVLLIITTLAYGIPFMLDRAGYAWEAGRSRAASEALAKLDESDIIPRSSALFRMANQVITPAVVNIRTVLATQPNEQELGSGVVIDRENGYIVTNEHVIRDAAQIVVRIGRSTDVQGTLIGFDARTDLAVVKVKGPLGVAAAWGDSSKLDVGEWVLAIGSPFALDRTVTAGIVSATGRHGFGRADAYEDYIQTDAAINPGNSGGPLINLRGQVIGINTAIINPREGQGIGLAISSEIARKVVDQLIKNGKVIRAYLGVVSTPLYPALVKDLNLPEGQEGAVVSDVRPDSPAARGGIRARDVIVGIDGKEVSDPSSLRTSTFTLPVGREVPVDLYRDGRKQTVMVAVAAMPEVVIKDVRAMGLEVVEAPVTQGGGVFVARVAPGSPAQDSGLVPGMRVVGLGKTPVRTKAEFDDLSARFDPVQGIPIAVMTRDGRVEFLNLTPLGNPRR